ncbi:hypothetical protein FGO68_gene9051 [Halteria grandinella]|uniref:NAD(P)-binding domain-containing protein n=1 Tax=Halteria grandinella TaxID=5974 RepID=A0A8J8NK32_HALGN|nr:hypothetical protein FGO68_gene9051 [Halteria grandinella]
MALDQGYTVTIYSRDPEKKMAKLSHPNLIKIKGQLGDEGAMDAAMKGKDAVVNCIGPGGQLSKQTTCSDASRLIMAAMKRNGVSRLLVCGSFGAGGHRDFLPWVVKKLIGNILDDKDRMEAEIFASGLEYTIARPPRLLENQVQGDKIFVGENVNVAMGEIHPKDVAQFLLMCLYEGSWINKTPHISSSKK